MKNKYIFLIIALGFGVYFLTRPQTGISDADMRKAQTLEILCRRMNRHPFLSGLCAIKTQFIPLENTSIGNTNNNGSGTTRKGFYIMNADGSMEFRPITFLPRQATYPSTYCGFNTFRRKC